MKRPFASRRPVGALSQQLLGSGKEIKVSVLVEDLDEPIDSFEIEQKFRDKRSIPKADIKVDSTIVERQRVEWFTRNDEVNAGDVKGLIESIDETVDVPGFFDFDTTGFEATTIDII
jgi:hypothetical protein